MQANPHAGHAEHEQLVASGRLLINIRLAVNAILQLCY